MNEKYVIIVASNPRVIEVAKNNGLKTILIQQTKQITNKDLLLADVVIGLNYNEMSKVNPLVKTLKNTYNIVGAITFSEDALLATAEICKTLELERNKLETVELLKNKIKMRNHLNNVGFSQINYLYGDSSKEVKLFSETHGFPFILKPVEGTASEGILKVVSQKDILHLDQWIEKHSINKFLLEEYIDGAEYSVEAFSVDGVHTVVAITEKNVNENFVELGHVTPSLLDEETKQEVNEFIVKFLNVIDLKFGPSHTEIKIGSKGIKIIESHNRIGGDGISQLVRMSTGIDLVEWCFNVFNEEDLVRYDDFHEAAAVKFLNLEPGIVEDVYYDEEILKVNPLIYHYDITVKPNDVIGEIRSSRDRKGFVMALGENPMDALQRAQSTVDTVIVKYQKMGANDEFKQTHSIC